MRLVRHGSVLLGLLLAPSACTTGDAPRTSNVATQTGDMFFENSVRRDATAAESALVAKLPHGCTGFFVENSVNKTYVVTAQHCVNEDVARWCPTSPRSIHDNDGNEGGCTRVIAADDKHDIAIFESDIPHASTGPTTLKLAAYTPPIGTRLVMIGYPLDDDPLTARHGRLTVTENCWTMSTDVPSPYESETGPYKDESANHNCSTYAGNSGGPMFREGTRDVIGLPYTYEPNDYTRRSSTDLSTAAFLALMSDFANVHLTVLQAAGVAISIR